MEKLVIGKNYWFDSRKNSKGVFIGRTDKGLEFEPIGEPGGYYCLDNGNVPFMKVCERDFVEAKEQPKPEALHETQKKQILDYLKTGKSITKLEALKMFGCWNSGDCIFNLRKEGYNIETTMITNGKKRFASYKLIENGN